MEKIYVKEIMVPLENYASVPVEATLYDAIMALEDAQKKFSKNEYQHRAVLVYDEKTKKVVGKVSQLDVLRALEPKYEQLGDSNPLSKFGLSRFGFSPGFMKSLLEQYKLWDKSLSDLTKKAAQVKVKNFMYTPTEGEYLDSEATIDEGIHQIVMGHHQSLLVTNKKKEIVGILRLTDIFRVICEKIKETKK
ncbi:MAG: CBS domain-containing protein [Desulfobacterales bacterium]|nr:CBS domain-containing protein [Desulfobacterales bacterium]